ncbi:response regulator [Oryzobacter telluris]|uniref:response regulator n=1 Tax=Oryzobacter telluris TaxID=3149179 RepID=UPI00370DA958
MRVLLVEDDPMVGAALVGRLEDEAYAVDWVQDAVTGLASVGTHTYDVVLLDLGLPGLDGAGFLSRLRATGNEVPVIVVTARDGVDSRVAGLDLGADDYLVKPFDSAELMARVRAVLRRRGSDHADAVLTNGRVSLDVARHLAWTVDGEQVDLPRREFAVLRALLTRPGVILSRDDLEHRVYGWGQEVESNAVEYAIHRLRAKLGADTIRNVRGVGWTVPKDTAR